MEYDMLLIRTKFNIPRISADFVEHPCLLDKLNQKQNRNITLITTPDGFGKTSLVVSSNSRISTEPAPYADSITTNDQKLTIFGIRKTDFREVNVE